MQSGFDIRQFAAELKGQASGILSQDIDDAEMVATRLVCELSEQTARDHVKNRERIDCQAGCDFCCIVNVAVLLPEAKSIIDYLVHTRCEEELSELYQALCQLERDTRWLDDEERIMSRLKCAFLDGEGHCSIYPARPLLCRSVTSTDAAACRDALAMVALGENRPVVCNLLQKEIFETAFSSFGDALHEHNIDNRSFRLAASVQRQLRQRLQ